MKKIPTSTLVFFILAIVWNIQALIKIVRHEPLFVLFDVVLGPIVLVYELYTIVKILKKGKKSN